MGLTSLGEGEGTMQFRTTEGYLVLADISGYTAFLVGTELEHAHAIIRELTALVRAELVPPLRFVKLEGDAVFCYSEAGVVRDGERIVELVEACYFAFMNRLDDMVLATTCDCRACESIGSLGLKFLVHYGDFVVDSDAGSEDLAGRDVILVHRLLKNTIGETRPNSAYAFFTDACLERMPPTIALPRHVESHEGLGTTTGGVHDLHSVYSAMLDARSERVSAEDADLELVADIPASPALVWQFHVDPVERQRWVCVAFDDGPDTVTPNRDGRAGVGSTSHCSHGPGTWFREVLDWRPFTYLTYRTVAPDFGVPEMRERIETVELTPVAAGTRVAIRTRLVDRGKASIEGFDQFRPLLQHHMQEAHEELRRVIEASIVPAPESASES